MYRVLYRYFMLFGFTLCILYAEGDIEKPSAKEEIKDTIVVHGMVLHGRVTNLGPEKLSFKLDYSDGINHIAYKDIDSIDTKYNYHISFKRMDIVARVVGIEDNTYLKVVEGDNHRTIKISDIDNFVMSVKDDDSLENKIRNTFPYASGNINFGFEIESGISKKNKLDILFNMRHKQAEHEILLFIDYAFETTETGDTAKVQNKDEFIGILTYKNHFSNDAYYYGAFSMEYDIPRLIERRYIPAVGYGYRFKFDKSTWLEPSIGMGYAKTSYTDNLYPDDNFPVAALQLRGNYQLDDIALINRLIVHGVVFYYPSLIDYKEDWILRSNLIFTVPLFDFFSVKLLFDFVNDSNPAPEIGNNKTTTKLLFGLDF